MTFFQSFVRSVSFPWIAGREGMPGLFARLRDLNATQFHSREQILALQFDRTKKLLQHAADHVPYYRSVFREAGFSPADFNSFEDLSRLPLLTKSIIRREGENLLADNIAAEQRHSSETGGTTGIKMTFYRDNACLAPKEAAICRFEQWAGWNPGERMGLVWPAGQDYVGHWHFKARVKNAFFRRQVVFPAALLDEEAIAGYIRLLRQKRPAILRAFVYPLHETAKYIIDQGIPDIRPKGVITTGEPLYEHQRRDIMRAFGCPVFDSYRSRELGPVAQECEAHDGMHINAESLYVEVVPPADPEKYEPGMGEIVVTDLLNYGMPFIRYKTGDMGTLISRDCSCGRGLPRLRGLSGRKADHLVTPAGKRISPGALVLYLIDQAPGAVGQVQVVQDRPDRLTLRYTPDPPLSRETMHYQQKKIRDLFGPGIKVVFEQVDEIQREQSGKYLFARCLLTEEQKQALSSK